MLSIEKEIDLIKSRNGDRAYGLKAFSGNRVDTTDAAGTASGSRYAAISPPHFLKAGELVRPLANAVRTANSLFIITRDDTVRNPGAVATRRWLLKKRRAHPGEEGPTQVMEMKYPVRPDQS